MIKDNKFLILLICFFCILPLSFSLNISSYTHSVVVDSFSFNPTSFYSGDVVSLAITLENRSPSSEVFDVNAFVDFNPYFESLVSHKEIDSLGAKDKQTFVYKFRVKEGTLAGIYSVPLSVVYSKKYVAEPFFQEDYNIFVSVSSFSSLELKNIELSNVTHHIGEKVKISGTIINFGTIEERDVKVSLIASDTNLFYNAIVPIGETQKVLGNLRPNESVPFEFELYLSDKLNPAVYGFFLNVASIDLTTPISEYFSVDIKGTPNLILSGVDFSIKGKTGADEHKIFQGDSFSISIQLDNIGEEKAKAVEVTINVDEGIKGMKTTYIGNIDVDDSGSAIFDLVASTDSKIGEHNAKLKVKYIDESNKTREISKEVAIFVFDTPPQSPIGFYIFVIIVLVLLAIIVRQVLRFLQVRSLKKLKSR